MIVQNGNKPIINLVSGKTNQIINEIWNKNYIHTCFASIAIFAFDESSTISPQQRTEEQAHSQTIKNTIIFVKRHIINLNIPIFFGIKNRIIN